MLSQSTPGRALHASHPTTKIEGILFHCPTQHKEDLPLLYSTTPYIYSPLW